MHTYRLKGASGKVANQSFPLGTRTLIGSSAECQVRVDEGNIAAQHAEITLQSDGRLVLGALGKSTDIFVNGAPVETIGLVSGDEIRIGSCRWVLQAPGMRPGRVLTGDALNPGRNYLPWLIPAAVIAAAALAWQRGWLSI